MHDRKLDEQLLDLVDFDIYFNRRRLVTKIQNHTEDLIFELYSLLL